MNNTLKHIIRLIVLLLLQGLLINNLHFLGVFHPYIYILCLLFLPSSLPRWVELLIGAAVGLVMDAICSTAGVHMAACVAVSYFRPLMISRLVQDVNRIGSQICSSTLGNWQFTALSGVMIILHHTLVMLLEAWSVAHLGWLIMSILLSSLMTFVLVFLYDRTQR